ncbi:hypothetical protein OOU_Y34scaffold00744g49 [Pyricularia oryzae Y34]|uniref:Uncharacterized protein n=2 Tax=Pyricularia oryzae TaxID=318829 RepID=A0AA97NRC3_PYRO3|nr:hypothetical protein OOU_Y34scaffold00744g49 [Pyricularia oryzae Y34]
MTPQSKSAGNFLSAPSSPLLKGLLK